MPKAITQLWLASAPRAADENSQPSYASPTEPLYLPQRLNTKSSAGNDAHSLGASSAARAKHRVNMVIIFLLKKEGLLPTSFCLK